MIFKQIYVSLESSKFKLFKPFVTLVAGFLIGNDDPPLMLGFLVAEGIGDDSCLRHAACTKPAAATEYVRAAKALMQGAQMMSALPSDEYAEHYRSLIKRMELAALDGLKGAQCTVKYRCDM